MGRNFIYNVFIISCGLLCITCAKFQNRIIDINQLPVEKNIKKSSGMGLFDFATSNHLIVDTSNINHTPLRYLRVNFHFINSTDKKHNFSEDSGRTFVYKLLPVMQVLFDKNDKMRLPAKNDIPPLPTRLQYVLAKQKGDDGIYFHYDDKLAFYNHMGLRSNNADYTVAEKYGIGLDSIINFFILPHHPDSLRSKTYQSGCVGIALGNAIKIAGIYEKGLNEWNVRGTFNHEVGHVLGLYHAWQDDGCEDTPQHANNCWADAQPGCQGKTSNNIMDYNAFQSAVTPCQLKIMHDNLSNLDHPNRKLLIPTWCTYDKSKKIIIRDSISWSTDRDLEGDLEIINGGKLMIKCRVSMAPGAKIIVHPTATLELENCMLHNACGNTWAGIESISQGRKTGKVIKYENAKIENVSGQ